MSELITIPRSDWREMKSAIDAVKEMIAVNDLVGREEACKILNISSKTFSNYLGNGKITPDSINSLKQPFFSRKKLLGL